MQDTFKSKCKMKDMLLTFQHGNSQFLMIDLKQKMVCRSYFLKPDRHALWYHSHTWRADGARLQCAWLGLLVTARFMTEVDGIPVEWETFREEEVDPSAKVALEALNPALWQNPAQDPVTIAELLDEGDSLLQEFRSGNEQLLERLCTPDSLRSLVEHATQPQSQGVPEERLRHRSHTAAELLAMCGQGSAKDDQWKLRLLNLFIVESDSSLLDFLWGFLLDIPVDPSLSSWNVLAGYFCNVVMALLHHFPSKVAGYLRTRGDAVFSNFMFFLGTRCIAELFVTLVCLTDVEEKPLFPAEGLMIRLVQQFSGSRPDGDDANENLALVINTMLCQACFTPDRIPFPHAVIQQMSSSEVIGTLLDKVISLKSPAAASVVSITISRFFGLSPNLMLPIRGPNLLKPLEEETHRELEVMEANSLGLPEARRALVQSVSKELPRLCNAILGHKVEADMPPAPPSVPRTETLREATKMLLEVKDELFHQETWNRFYALGSPDVEEVLRAIEALNCEETSEAFLKSEMLSRLRRSLAAVKVEENQMREMQQRHKPFSGQLAVEATTILLELNRTQDSEILQVFLEHDLLIRCIHHFFVGSCGSIMLNTVVAFCLEIIRGPQNASIQAVCRLLEDGDVMRRLAHALSSAAAFREAVTQKAKREPNPHEHTGLLRKICGELRDAGSMSPEVQERLDAMQCWTEVVLPELEEFAQLEQEPLGGIPSLESPSLPVKVEDAEFTPEDLRDLDEDLDTEFLLDLGKLSQREAVVAARKEEAQLQSWHLGGLTSTQDNSAEDRGEWVWKSPPGGAHAWVRKELDLKKSAEAFGSIIKTYLLGVSYTGTSIYVSINHRFLPNSFTWPHKEMLHFEALPLRTFPRFGGGTGGSHRHLFTHLLLWTSYRVVPWTYCPT